MTRLADLYQIDNFIDTFALGHYARVVDATDLRTSKQVAFKVLRPEHVPTADADDLTWEYRAFANEGHLLLAMAANPHVVDLLDCGYVSTGSEAPAGGEIVSYGTDIAAFGDAQRAYARETWRPYLALQNLPRNNNLLYLMKPNRSSARRRLPTEEGLALALQFAETLRTAHRQAIVYMDHKLEHVYWDGLRLQLIDWNSSRQLEAGTRDAAVLFKQDIRNLCVGVLYPVFTGLSPSSSMLRAQPGSITDVEARYQGVTELDFGMEPTLSPSLVALLQSGAATAFDDIDQFIEALKSVASNNGWDFSEYYTSPASRNARTQLRSGLEKLRAGQDCLREARDILRDAAIVEGITPDLEDELRRLVKAANDALNYRVVP